MELTYKGQTVRVALPDKSVWDASQIDVVTEYRGHKIGRGDFEVMGYRILAENQTVANMIARRLRGVAHQPKVDRMAVARW